MGPAPPLNDPLFLAIVPDDVLLEMVTQGRPNALMPGFARPHGGRLTAAQVHALANGIKRKWQPGDETATVDLPPYLLAETDSSAPDSAAVQRGRELFANSCAGCHGENGAGGEDAMAGPLNNARLLELFSDQVLRRLIITGRPDLGMPSYAGAEGRPDDFQPLTSEQITDLVALLRHFRAGGPADPASPLAMTAAESNTPSESQTTSSQSQTKTNPENQPNEP